MEGATHGDLFELPGEMARRTRAFDWSSTELGAPERWPNSLRSAVRLVLASRYPMILTWGPAYTQFYNDAYSTLIGTKHPGALGTDLRVTLAEGWPVLQPLIEDAMRTRVASWAPRLLLLLERAGYREEAYFDVSHSGLADDDGRVTGMHAVCSEVTERVLDERRMRVLHELSKSSVSRRDEAATATAIVDVMATAHLDVPFAALLRQRPGAPIAVVARTRIDDSQIDELLRAHAGVDLADGSPVTIAVPADLDLTGGPWGDPVTTALLVPLGDTVGGAALLVGASPNRALDEEHRSFIDLLASQVASSLATARADEQERRRIEALEALDRAKSEFFANVSHEFRTPLTLILGPIEDALDDAAEPLGARQRERMVLAARNARRLRRLVESVLEFTRLEVGHATLHREPVDLGRFTADVASVFRAAVERAGLTFDVRCPPMSRSTLVDPTMWEQLVSNLLSNALKFTFSGGVSVTVQELAGETVLEVSDTGIGIPDDQLSDVFERFHRVRGATARTHEGTGIGLALVREIAALHGGVAEVTSRSGRGSTFRVRVPLAEVALPTISAQPGHASGAFAEEALGWSDQDAPAPERRTREATVLVVDDNADLRAHLASVLSPHFEVVTAGDGRSAFALALDRRPDVVVTDVMMPIADGFELVRLLRGDERTAHVPVVMLSARAGEGAAAEGLDRGADDYLVKPFASRELVARVRARVRSGRRTDAPDSPSSTSPSPSTPSARSGTAPVRPPADAPSPDAPVVVVAESDAALVLRVTSAIPAIGPARRRIAEWLRGSFDDEQLGDIQLVVSEALTNAVEHAVDPEPPVIEVVATAAPVLRVEIADHGRWRPRTSSMDRGRGSTIMSALAEVVVVPQPSGTTVTLTFPFGRAPTAAAVQ